MTAPPPTALPPHAPRQLPLSRLGHLVPPLVEGQALVALVPVSADLVWAAKAAWDIARIAARGGRRVALVDLGVEEPSLHLTVGLAPADGIVDAFEYGVSLNTAAHAVDGVYFIAAGSFTARAGDLYAHPRWTKLHAGFRSEGALLLLFLSPAALARLSAVADGAIVLAPEGFDPSATAGGGADIGAAVERGTVLLGVARDRWMPSPHPHFTDAGVPAAEPPRAAGRRWRRGRAAAILTLTLAGAGAGTWALFAGPAIPDAPTPAAPSSSPARAPAAVSADTLAWAIQLAAYGSLAAALEHADRLIGEDGEGTPALVSPVPRSGSTVWYRVLAGSYRTRESAAAAREALWRSGAARRGIGDLLRAPYSFTLDPRVSIDTLRARGLPAVRGRFLGAFETPEQAAYTEAQLTRAGVRATLLPRLGTTP